MYSSRAQPESSSEWAACLAGWLAWPAVGGCSELVAAPASVAAFMTLLPSSMVLLLLLLLTVGSRGSKWAADEWSSLGHLQFRQTCLKSQKTFFAKNLTGQLITCRGKISETETTNNLAKNLSSGLFWQIICLKTFRNCQLCTYVSKPPSIV